MSFASKTRNFINDDIVSDRSKLEGYYKFTKDLSDNSRTLTANNDVTEVSEYTDSNNVTRYFTTLFNNATNAYLDGPTSLLNAMVNTDITIGFGINTTSNDLAILLFTSNTLVNRFHIGITSGGNVEYRILDNNSYVLRGETTSVTVNDGNWHTVSIIIGSGGNNILIDGEFAAMTYTNGSASTTNTIPSLAVNTFYIGHSLISGHSYFNGYLDNISFVSQNLSFDERLYISADSGLKISRLSANELKVTHLKATSTYNTVHIEGQLFLNRNTQNFNTGWILTALNGVGADPENFQFFKRSNNTDTLMGFLEDDAAAVGPIDFTGQHRACPVNNSFTEIIGYIVVSTGKYCKQDIQNDVASLLYGIDAITINDAIPIVDYSTQNNQKSVFGVISEIETDSINRVYSQGIFSTNLPKVSGDHRLIINSVGEGAIWVCDISGNFTNGDYITTCTLSGLGAKQTDDILHSYTVAKITMDCDFSGGNPVNDTDYQIKWVNLSGVDTTESDYNTNGGYVCAFVGCTYHCG